MLQTSTVHAHTLVLLKELQSSPLFSELRLVGGTALALQLGHRFSIDLDFFGILDTETPELIDEITSLGFKVMIKRDTKAVKMFDVDNVKVDIVNYPYAWIEPAIETEGVRMAGMKDIAAMKLAAITNRGTRKDFVDIYFLLQYYSLNEMLGFYEQKFHDGSSFMALRSLSYFDDAEEQPMPKMFRCLEWEAVKRTVQESIRGLNLG